MDEITRKKKHAERDGAKGMTASPRDYLDPELMRRKLESC